MRSGPSRQEIVELFVDKKLKVSVIAERFGITRAWVYMNLKAAGVAMPPRKVRKAQGPPKKVARQVKVKFRKATMWRNSGDVMVEKLDWEIAPPAPSIPLAVANPHLFHCLGVLRANGGRGFPFGGGVA